MKTISDNHALTDDNLSSEQRFDILNSRIRKLVRALLLNGGTGGEISYSLAFVSTEMGMQFTNNASGVLVTVLEGINDAAKAAIEYGPIQGYLTADSTNH